MEFIKIHHSHTVQKEAIHTGSIVLKIEFEADHASLQDSTAYSLVVHEKHCKYNFSKQMRQE